MIKIKNIDREITKNSCLHFLKSKPQKADLALVFGTRHQEAVDKVFELYNNK